MYKKNDIMPFIPSSITAVCFCYWSWWVCSVQPINHVLASLLFTVVARLRRYFRVHRGRHSHHPVGGRPPQLPCLGNCLCFSDALNISLPPHSLFLPFANAYFVPPPSLQPSTTMAMHGISISPPLP